MRGKRVWAAVGLVLVLCLLARWPAVAGSLAGVYDRLKDDPQYQDYLESLRPSWPSTEAMDAEIKSFLEDLEAGLDRRGNLTPGAEFREALKSEALSLIWQDRYERLFNAILSGISSEELNDILAGNVPARLRPVLELVEQAYFEGPGGLPGGAGAAVPAAPAVGVVDKGLVEAELAKGKPEVTFAVPAGTGAVKIAGEALAALAEAGKALVLNMGEVSMRIPPGAFELSSPAASLTVSFLAVPAEEVSYLTRGLPPEYKTGRVYDISAKTELGGREEVPRLAGRLHVTCSYQGLGFAPELEEKLGAYFYDQTVGRWEYAGGKVDAKQGVVVFSVSRFGKYGLIAYDKTFADVAGHWAQKDIEYMAARHVARGVTAAEFRPEGLVTRAEFAALLVRTLGLEADTDYELGFSDVDRSSWYYGEVAAAFRAGLVRGVSATEFAPQKNITREEIAAMLARASAMFGQAPELAPREVEATLAAYADAARISGWARAEVARAVQAGVISGRSGNALAPRDNATRAETVVMLRRLRSSAENFF